MSALEFLKQKGIISKDYTEFIVRYPNTGKKFNMVDIMEEFVEVQNEWTDQRVADFLKWYLDISSEGEHYFANMVERFKSEN